MYIIFILPAVWLCYLLGVYLKAALVLALGGMGAENLSLFMPHTETMAYIGLGFTLLGNLVLVWEMVKHRNFPYNLDAAATYLGGTLVLISFMLGGVPDYLGTGVLAFALLTLPNSTAYVVRGLYRFTITALGSTAFFFIHLALLAAATKLAMMAGLDMMP